MAKTLNGPEDPAPHSPAMAKQPTVRLNLRNYRALWWVARCSGKELPDLIEELTSLATAQRLTKYAPDIAKLKKADEETARLEAEAQAREKAAG